MNKLLVLCLSVLMEFAVPVHAGEPADPRKKIDMPAMIKTNETEHARSSAGLV